MSDNPHDLISIGEVTIPFYEDNLIVQLGEDGEIYVALRPIVQALGLLFREYSYSRANFGLSPNSSLYVREK